MSFLQHYFEITTWGKEVAVCCPFPHTLSGSAEQYLEQHPSAHVNLEEGLFHCKACGRGLSEVQFMVEILGCSFANALRLVNLYKNEEDLILWEKETALHSDSVPFLQQFKITPIVMQELHLASKDTNTIGFPVFMYDKLIDIRWYSPEQKPKVKSRAGAMSGLILPYDAWRQTPKSRTTLICAGEKDMAVARSYGFNAITITGGETALPNFTQEFKGRKVAIVYDNDHTGKLGAVKLANFLKPLCDSVKNCTGFHEVCQLDKEDITDFFVKYGKTKGDLIHYLEQTPEHELTAQHQHNARPLVDLLTASKPENVGKLLRSNIQIVAVSEAAFVFPSSLIVEKWRKSDSAHDSMHPGEIREWTYTEDTAQDILHLIDNNFTEDEIKKNYAKIMHINPKETYLKYRKLAKETVYKAYVTDLFETSDVSNTAMEYTAYVVGIKLESGKKYKATYKVVPHPYKGQQLVMLIVHVEQAEDSVSNFQITPAVRDQLAVYQTLEGSVPERMQNLVERFKTFLGYNGNNTLITALDLAYHTPLEFNFATFRNIRGYLDTLVVGESRMGKSSTADAMRKTYNLGAFVSLAGNAATIPGLVGGSNKTGGGSYQTRAGLIPQNHRGLIIFEELGKSHANVIAELTDIRSSNEVRITRVSGTLTMPASVRMLTLSNVRPVDGVIKPITSYPHGIAVLTELIGTAEDIARYDVALVLGDRGNATVDPFWEPEPAFDPECYRARVRWVWSRSPEQIIFLDGMERYLVDRANELNRVFDSHIKIFGTEAWKKLARVAIATAGCLVSTDDSHTRILIGREHIDFAVDFLRGIYDNTVFRLKEYVEHERKFSQLDVHGVQLLQEIYMKAPGMLLHLEQVPSTSKNALQAASGLDNDKYNALMNQLVTGLFITFSKYEIIPTPRFRMGMGQIERNTRVRRIGEEVG